MKTTNKIYLVALAISIAISQFSYSQNLGINGGNALSLTSDLMNITGDNVNVSALKADGSAYINDNFVPVKIKGFDELTYSARYNAYNAKLEVDLGDKVIALDSKRPYEVTFVQEKKTYKSFNFTTADGVSKSQFLVVAKETENYSLLKEERISYYAAVPASSPYGKDKSAKFVRQDDLFYIKKGDNISVIESGKKGIYNSFPEHEKAIKTFVKSNDLSTTDENDLIKIVDYIMSIK